MMSKAGAEGWSGRRCLVTGGAGFIGSSLVEQLVERGATVRVIDNLSAGNQNVPFIESLGAEFHNLDIADHDDIKELFADIEVVFHLAAMNRAQRSINDPITANQTNIDGTLYCLKAALDSGVKKFVFASSSSVYKGVEDSLLSEEMPLRPPHPYGVGKLAGEHYCRLFNDLYGLPTTVLRYFSVYGPRQRGDIDFAAVIPKFILAALRNEDITVYGDGNQSRNFTYVGDVVRGTMLAGGSDKVDGVVMNLAAEQEVTVNAIANAVVELIDTDSNIVHLPPIKGDPARNPADISRAKELLGYTPEFSLEEGIKRTLEAFELPQ